METTGTDRVNEGAVDAIPQTDAVMDLSLHGDPERLETTEQLDSTTSTDKSKRRQPFRAVWVVVACGFALMSDSSSYHMSS